MPNYKKTLLVLPEETYATLAQLDETGDIDTRDSYIAALRDARWTLQSIATAVGITRERVRQIARDNKSDAAADLSVPTPPLIPTKPGPVYIEPDPVKLARLLELQPLAQSVRANSPKFREEAEEYTALLAECHQKDKVTLYRLALRLGVTHGALRFRLARYGYLTPAEGSSKVYTPVLQKNRAIS